MVRTATIFQGIPEVDEEFLRIWPHRFDFLYANHPEPGEKPNWQTDKRHRLNDRPIKEGRYLYGVRFGKTTNYCLLDIDAGSEYHPSRDLLGFRRIQESLEDLGLVSSLVVQSSTSGGIHLYFPLGTDQTSWEVGVAVTTLLENQGLHIKPGILEVYPNPRPLSQNGDLPLYLGHRLPLQYGSFLLNKDLEPILSYPTRFVQEWKWAESRNSINPVTTQHLIKQSRHTQYSLRKGARKFLDDLNAEIDPGWTGPGQSNYILGRIAMRSYIFGHVINPAISQPLEGEDLVDNIITTAQSLPGFNEFSKDVHCIRDRAKQWARSVETSPRYYHYGGKGKRIATTSEEQINNYNKAQKEIARQKIADGLSILSKEGSLPAKTTARAKILISRFKMSASTLYKHKDLWHPEFILETAKEDDKYEEVECALGASTSETSTSLLGGIGCNPAPVIEQKSQDARIISTSGCNPCLNEDKLRKIDSDALVATPSLEYVPISPHPGDDEIQSSPPSAEISNTIRTRIKCSQQASSLAKEARSKIPPEQCKHLRGSIIMSLYQKSGIPELVAEAKQFFAQGFVPVQYDYL